MKKSRKAMALGLAMALALGGIEPGLATINVFAAENGIQTTADETREEITLTSDQLNNETLKGMDLTNKIIHLDPSITSIADDTFDNLNLSNSVLDFTGLTGDMCFSSVMSNSLGTNMNLENTTFNFGDITNLTFSYSDSTFSNVYINVNTVEKVDISHESGLIHLDCSNDEFISDELKNCIVHNANIISPGELYSECFMNSEFHDCTIILNIDDPWNYKKHAYSSKFYNTKVKINSKRIPELCFGNAIFDDKSSLEVSDKIEIGAQAFKNATLPECVFKPPMIDGGAFANCDTSKVTLDLSDTKNIYGNALNYSFKKIIPPNNDIEISGNSIIYFLDNYISDDVITIPENITLGSSGFLEDADLTQITKVIVKGKINSLGSSSSENTRNIDLILTNQEFSQWDFNNKAV